MTPSNSLPAGAMGSNFVLEHDMLLMHENGVRRHQVINHSEKEILVQDAECSE